MAALIGIGLALAVGLFAAGPGFDRDEFFPPERDGAGAAVAGADVDPGLVEELYRGISKWALTLATRSLAA